MKRVMIIGCPGSGKSTLAKKLSSKLKLPVIHLDQLNWTGHWQMISSEVFDALLLTEVQKEAWIIDGNYDRTISLRIQYCDTVIFLNYSKMTCLCGVIKRVLKGYGKTRSDMGGNCPERFDISFLKFVWDFNSTYRSKYLTMLSQQTDKNVMVFHHRKECQQFLDTL